LICQQCHRSRALARGERTFAQIEPAPFVAVPAKIPHRVNVFRRDGQFGGEQPFLDDDDVASGAIPRAQNAIGVSPGDVREFAADIHILRGGRPTEPAVDILPHFLVDLELAERLPVIARDHAVLRLNDRDGIYQEHS